MHLYCKNESPKPIGGLFIKSEQVQPYQTRHRSYPRSTKAKLNITFKNFLCVGPKIWSNLQSSLQSPDNPGHEHILQKNEAEFIRELCLVLVCMPDLNSTGIHRVMICLSCSRYSFVINLLKFLSMFFQIASGAEVHLQLQSLDLR